MNSFHVGLGLGGMRSSPHSAPTSPPPLIPPHPPAKPVAPPPFQSQTRSSLGQPPGSNLQPLQQRRIPSPPSAKPLPPFTQPSSASFGFGNDAGSSANESRSGTFSVQPSLQQQKPASSSLFSPAAAPTLHTPGKSSNQGPGPSGGKLSAQDLSFFEGL
jgi:hypothetical protein